MADIRRWADRALHEVRYLHRTEGGRPRASGHFVLEHGLEPVAPRSETC